ncbi:C40 family peptidase [Romboutsia sp.]|uniref:C40 family peptidase n=1 Tax=Romboutsia sp. TaxID=1965302 RepID=UPI003F307A0E
MINKKGIVRTISKIATTAILLSLIYIAPSNNEVYAYPNTNSVTQAKTEKGIVKPCDYLNVRKGPNVKYSTLSKLYTNESIEILEKDSNKWYKIKSTKGVIGWVNSQYIKIQPIQTSTSASSKSKKIVDLAYKQIGKPYSWGASGPKAFDCSGLTSYVYKNASGITLPRTSKQQATVGKTVSKKNLKPGDLVFFSSTGRGITHVGLYIGNSKMIHSPKPGQNIRIDSINSAYYSRTFVTAKSII